VQKQQFIYFHIRKRGGNVMMLKRSMAMLVMTALLCMLTASCSAAASPSEWAREQVSEAISLGLVPDDMQDAYTANTTREAFCDILILLIGKLNITLPENVDLNVFSDTNNPNVAALYAMNIVTGVDEGTFNPKGIISRQEAAVILSRTVKALGKTATYSKAGFSDEKSIAEWAADSVFYIAGSGIMTGTGEGFDPLGAYTREQTIVTVLRLYQFINSQTTPSPSKKDLDSSWDSPSAVITLSGQGISVEGEGVSSKGNTATITEAGTYVLAGTLTDGQIVIDAGKEALVRLVLNGVDITNKTGAPIYAAACDKLVVILADDTQNTLTDGGDSFVYADEISEEPNAAFFCKDDLTINGKGSLTVNAGFNNGIGTKDDLVIISGNITVTAANHALRGNDSVAVYGGAFMLTAGSDGIQTSNSEDLDKGWIYIADGNFTIKAANDGIQAEAALTIENGTFEITTGGGAAAAPVRQDGFGGAGAFPGGGDGTVPDRANGGAGAFPGGGRPQGNMGGGAPPAADVTAAADTDSISMKAVKSGKNLIINGGTFIIDAEDDGVHSDLDLTVNGGDFTAQTGDDGFHATNALIITGGNIRVTTSYEGLEGSTVEISGGNIYADASDDAINAAGGAGSTGAHGRMGGDSFTQKSSHYIRISGGVVDVSGGRDGIDSNGNIFLEGGTVYVSGQSQGMDGALDMDGTFTVTGGTLITAGSVMTPSQNSTQASLLVGYTAQNAEGSVITLKDANGNTVLEYTSRIAFSASGFTSPVFTQGQTYSLWINGEKRSEIQLSGVVTSVSENGGAYSIGGRGGMGGGRGQGQRQMPQDGTAPTGRTPGGNL
jgi:hypothetical protein